MFSHCWGGGRLAETPVVRRGIPSWEGTWTIPLFLGLCPWRSSSHFLWLFILFFAPRTRVFYMSEMHVSCFSLLCCFYWTCKANIPSVTSNWLGVSAPILKNLHLGGPHHCSIKMASCTALGTHPLLSQNIPGQQTTSGFRGCQFNLLFKDIPGFLIMNLCIYCLGVASMKLWPPLWLSRTCNMSCEHSSFDIVTNVFVLMFCFLWKGKCIRGNFTDFFLVLKMH